MPPSHIDDLLRQFDIRGAFGRILGEDGIDKLQALGKGLQAGTKLREIRHRPQVLRVGQLVFRYSHHVMEEPEIKLYAAVLPVVPEGMLS